MYTTDSSFLSGAPGTVQQWVDAITPHNPAQAAAIVAAYTTYGPQCGINYDLALAQACHESGWFTSAHWVNQFDPCGLGVTSDTVAGASFASMEDGIKAHYQHLSCYTQTEDPPVFATWGMLDPRHDFHDGMPAVKDLVRDNRKWAVPGDGYADSIVAIANQVAGDTASPAAPPVVPPAQGGTPVGNEPTQDDIGYPVEVDYATLIGPDRAVADVQWFIVHDTEGGEQGSEGVLKGNTASVHAMIDTDGSLEYMVPIEKTAWTAGNDAVSKLAIQVELVGFAANSYPEEQYKSLAAFYRWCQARGMTVPVAYIGRADKDGGPLPDAPGIIGHQDVPNPNVPGAWGGFAGHTDPGVNFDWQHFVDLVKGEPAAPGVSPTYRKFAQTGHGIDGGFKTYWEANGGLAIFGFPLTEEMDIDGRTGQYFQRCVMRYFPEFKGTLYEVQLDLLGALAAKNAGITGAGIG